MEGIKLLLAEDDYNLGYLLKESLTLKGFSVSLFKNGEEAWKAFNEIDFDIAILDVMMPGMDGFNLASQIRLTNKSIPIIFLTARNQEQDKIKGFEIGADDYITKPFSANELYYRIHAILKRTIGVVSNDAQIDSALNSIKFGEFEFDYINRCVIINGIKRKLSTKENELIRVFAENPNKVIARSHILNQVWGNDDYFSSKSMDVYLTKIRKLFREQSNVELQNIHGTGFKLIVNK